MLTSPPPTTRTFLSLTCQATIIDPPPWTSGNFCAMMSYIHLIIENRRLDVRMHYSIIGPAGGFRYGNRQEPKTTSVFFKLQLFFFFRIFLFSLLLLGRLR